MRAMVVRKYGTPENLESQEVPEPQSGPDEILIRVRAVGINFADLLQRMGIYPGTPKPPFIPGLEVAGTIEQAPPGEEAKEAEGLKAGDRVVALVSFKAYAERVTAAIRSSYRIPENMPFEEAAAIPVNYLTAYHSMVTMGNLQPGDRILIHGAAGGVGIAAVQLARARGLIVFGTAGPSKQDYLRRTGVDHPIDYSREDFVQVVRRFAPDGIEMAMDPIGGRSFHRSAECLGPIGRLVVYGFSAVAGPGGQRSFWRGAKALFETPRFGPLKLMRRNLAVIGVHLGHMQKRGALLRSELDELFRMWSAGRIKPVIGKTFPLEEAAAAHRFIHNRQNIGKVVLTVS